MIVLVCGQAAWAKVNHTMAYFHDRHRFTRVIGDNQLAKRWAMENGVPFQERDPLKGINSLPRKLVAFPGDDAIVDMARARGIRVVEVV